MKLRDSVKEIFRVLKKKALSLFQVKEEKCEKLI
jgi:hypothetical protein